MPTLLPSHTASSSGGGSNFKSNSILNLATVNSAGKTHANNLISAGKIDRTSSWEISAADENAILGDPPDWGMYSKWHLGVDTSQADKTKGRYKYPFGKNGKVYLSALRAIRSRAGQQDDTGVFEAAGVLLEKAKGDEDKDKISNVASFEVIPRRFEVLAKDNKEASIYLYDSIGASFFGGISADRFIKELNALGKVKKINLYVNSDGGDVFEGSAIYTRLVQHPAEIIANIDGLAASIMSLIVMAGTTINISDQGMLMIHEPWTGMVGNAIDLRKRADVLDKLKANLISAYSRRTNLPENKLSQMLAEETWMSATEAFDLGFVDNITTGQLMAASCQPYDLSRFKHTPSWYNRPKVPTPKLLALRAKKGKLFQLINPV